MAFRPDVVHPAVPPQTVPPAPFVPPEPPDDLPAPPNEPPIEEQPKPQPAVACTSKNPLTCLFSAFRNREKSGFASEDFLLIGLIALLFGKEGNEDILLILAMLLLV